MRNPNVTQLYLCLSESAPEDASGVVRIVTADERERLVAVVAPEYAYLAQVLACAPQLLDAARFAYPGDTNATLYMAKVPEIYRRLREAIALAEIPVDLHSDLPF